MFSYWFIFCVIGLVVPIITKIFWNQDVTLKEIGIIGGINLLLITIVFGLSLGVKSYDIEIHNGKVTSKSKDKVSCSHSYQCFCRTVSCGKDCTTTVCQTCYEHKNDWDYNVQTTLGNIRIKRVDRQGKNTPPRFDEVIIGEPVSLERRFLNYIKMAEKTLFKDDMHHSSSLEVSPYPNVYDYYRINRVINTSSTSINTTLINDRLNSVLRELGPKQKMNIVVYFWNHEDDNYDRVVQSKWLGGKKNDLVIMIKVQDNTINRVHSFGFSSDSSVYYRTNRLVQEVIEVNEELITEAILEGSKNFIKESMEEYAYLQDEIQPSIWLIVFSSLISLGVSSFLSYKAIREDW